MKTLNIKQLTYDLVDLTSSFEGKSVDEYKRLIIIATRISEIIHGKRSFNVLNYEALSIETELANKINVLRLKLLNKMLEIKDEYHKKELKECWENFILANDLNYGSFKTDGSGWSHSELANKVKNMFFVLVVDKLTKQLMLKNISYNKKKEFLKMLNGLKARYNGSQKNYTIVHDLLKKFDNKKEIIGTNVYV